MAGESFLIDTSLTAVVRGEFREFLSTAWSRGGYNRLWAEQSKGRSSRCACPICKGLVANAYTYVILILSEHKHVKHPWPMLFYFVSYFLFVTVSQAGHCTEHAPSCLVIILLVTFHYVENFAIVDTHMSVIVSFFKHGWSLQSLRRHR